MTEGTSEASARDRVFVSYRRDDVPEQARNLRDAIDGAFGAGTAFFDEASIEVGAAWPQRLMEAIAAARAVVVVIGPRWLGVDEFGMRRIDEAEDWCREEVATALELGKPVLSVLVDAKMPPARALPEALRALRDRQAVTMPRDRWGTAVKEVIAKLAGLLGGAAGAGVESTAAPVDVLALYRQHLRTVHAHLISFTDAGDTLLDEVFVHLHLREERLARGKTTRGTAETLATMLARPPAPATGVTGAWLVTGEPGAGKSTIARHLTWTLAGRTEPQAPIPIYVPLAAYAAARDDPLHLVEAELAAAAGESDAQGLAKTLRALAGPDGEPGRVWLLLDGLDEVAPEHAERLRGERLPGLRERLPHARIAVLSRPVGAGLGVAFCAAQLQPLGPVEQARLLEKWLPAERAAEVLERLGTQPQLERLVGNPLLLTLIAQLEGDLPTDRIELYHRAVEMLLRKPYGRQTLTIDAPLDARRALAGLALALQQSPASAWSLEELHEALWRARQRDQAIERSVGSVWGGDNEQLLQQLALRTGLLAPHDGPQAKWRFLHGQLREYLAAEGLWRVDQAWREVVGELDGDAVPRWSETLGFYCGRDGVDPLEVLGALRAADEHAAVKALGQVHGVRATVLFDFLWELEAWNGDDLRPLVQAWRSEGLAAPEELVAMLWARVRPALSVERLAWLHFALRALGELDEDAFFNQAGRPRAEVEGFGWVQIAGGTFAMGSPEDEAERFDDEGPQLAVSVPPFELLATPVTNAQYAQFDPKHTPETFDGRVPDAAAGAHPVVNVDWWEAYLFCAWVRARLPTEAEWEYACRAGTTGPFSFEGALTPQRVNYDGNYPYAEGERGEYRECTVPAGSLPANAWGPHEMHGNVFEWCQDRWHQNYEDAPEDGSAWELGGSADRVVRGGSWFARGPGCRSAFRYGIAAGDRLRDVGVRPARSSP